MKFILALDQGTTSSRAILFDHAGIAVASAQQEFRQHFPQPGWVEHDPEEIWASQLATAKAVLRDAQVDAGQVAAIGITNQRETTIVWDRGTGDAISNAIVWQDRRTADVCDGLRRDQADRMIRKKTGLIPDAYFSATKLQWILKNVKSAKQRARKGELAFGTVDSWLLWKLTEGRVHATDPSNACRTMLFNIHKGDWDEKLLRLFEVPREMLPEVRSSSEVFGHTTLLGGEIPIAGIAGDQSAALFGQMCHRPGMVKNTYGTGCFMLMHTGDKPMVSRNNLLTSVAWKINGKTEYALEGSIFIAGAVVQWLRDGLRIIRKSADIETLAAEVPDSGGVVVVPAFAGLGAPHWDAWARGLMIGLTRGTTSAHVARAALESIAFQVTDVLNAMQADAGLKVRELRVDGGAAANNLLMQFQADLLNVPVVRPQVLETTALGAAYLAGLAVGFWKNKRDIDSQWKADARFTPGMKNAERETKMRRWERALERSKAWEE